MALSRPVMRLPSAIENVAYVAAAVQVPRAYTGESAHTEHIHFSGAYTQASDGMPKRFPFSRTFPFIKSR